MPERANLHREKYLSICVEVRGTEQFGGKQALILGVIEGSKIANYCNSCKHTKNLSICTLQMVDMYSM